MTRRVEYAKDLTIPPEAVFAVIRQRHPDASVSPDGACTWTEVSTLGSDATMDMTALVAADPRGSRLTLTCSYDAVVPYFEWAFAGLVRRSTRDRLVHEAGVIEAAVAGLPPPSEPKRPWWSPPDSFTSDQIRIIATISLVLALVEYGNSLLSQTVDYVAHTYDATNAQLGVVTAVTRVGNLLVLVGGLLADRLGRRRLLIGALTIVLVATTLSAAAPSLHAFGALQVLVNGATNLALLVAYIVAVEEAPEGSRTYTLAIITLAAGLGFAVGSILLPIADADVNAWRGLYAVAALGLLALPSISRRLTETKRFEALAARHARTGRVGEVIDQRYGARFVLMCATGFLLYVFLAPGAQFINRYLGDERAFTGSGILLLRAITQTVTALGATYIGGRLAESSGRKPSAIQGLLLGAVATAVFFAVGGPLLWISLAIGTAALSFAGPALTAFGAELFPTEVRGTAGAGLTIVAVLGSATGLLLVGYLADPLGSVGKAVALTSVAPIIVATFFIRHLPEAKGRLLDEVSPPEV
jgi:MFS family permease